MTSTRGRCGGSAAGRGDLVHVVDQIADDDDQPAAVDAFGHVVEHGADVGVVRGRLRFEQLQHAAELRRPGFRRQIRSHAVVEQHQPDGVVLLQQQVREGRGQVGAPLELAHLPGLEGHRLGAIEQDGGTEVGLILKELDVILVGAGEDLPVQRPQLVAGHIGAMIEVLDGEAVIRRTMPAGEKTLDDLASDQLQVAKAREAVGVEELGHEVEPFDRRSSAFPSLLQICDPRQAPANR